MTAFRDAGVLGEGRARLAMLAEALREALLGGVRFGEHLGPPPSPVSSKIVAYGYRIRVLWIVVVESAD